MRIGKSALLLSLALLGLIVGLASCDLFDIHVTGVTLDASDWTALKSTGSQQLVATISPSNATNKKVTWKSSDPANFPVSSTGLVTDVSGVAIPNLVVTVTTDDGDFTATCTGSASCPIVFVGDGNGKFNYLTDLQGPIIGMPGSVSISTKTGLFTDDYIVLEGLKADPAGVYQVKLREVQAEITYLDNIKFIPVDLPDGYELASSTAEHTYGAGVVNPLRFYTLKSPKSLRSAAAWDGKDVTAQLKAADGLAAPSEGIDLPYYTLDFGAFDAAHAKLVLKAWALYSSTYGGKQLILPSVSVKNAAGDWTEVKTFGIPGGDIKTMIFDLSGLFPTADRHVRLSLGSRPWVRWVVDSVALDDSAPVAPIVGAELQPATAVLATGGGATQVLPDFKSRGKVLDDSLPFNGVGLGQGRFTRYGDVGPLVAATDDEYAIMGMGDQVSFGFGPLAPPKPGYHRVMVLKILQYYKAPYVNTAVLPLPFKGMTAYPYGPKEHYPDDAAHQAYQATYNTRVN